MYQTDSHSCIKFMFTKEGLHLGAASIGPTLYYALSLSLDNHLGSGPNNNITRKETGATTGDKDFLDNLP